MEKEIQKLGEFLKYVRRERGLTQDEVAEKLSVVTPVISKWENDKSVPDLASLSKLCTVLSVSMEEINSRMLKEGARILPPENYDGEKVGTTIKKLRIKNGFSQSEVGEKLFVTGQTVSKWENGGVNTLEVLNQLCELFQVSPDVLLSGRSEDSSTPVLVDRKTVKKYKIFSLVASIAFVVMVAVFGVLLSNLFQTEEMLKKTQTALEQNENIRIEYQDKIAENNALIEELKAEIERLKAENEG